MLLNAIAFSEFTKFIQISSLIALALLALLLCIAAIFHYRKKKKEHFLSDKDTVVRLIEGTPEKLSYKEEKADYIFYDQSGLINAYKSKLIYSHARFTAMKQDYNKVNIEYDRLLQETRKPLYETKKNSMQELNGQFQYANSETLATWMSEKNELEEKLRQLNGSFKSLEKENALLSDQIAMLAGTDAEKTAIVNEWKKEKEQLSDKVAEQDYLKDIIVEKKNQIEFLQQQIDNRIQKFHTTELRANELNLQLEQANKALDDTKSTLKATEKNFIEQMEQAKEFKQSLAEKEEIITEKLNTITWLENALKETKQQNEMLNAIAADNNEKVIALVQTVEAEQAKVAQLQQKLVANRQVLGRLQKEITSCMEVDQPASLVVELNPVYVREKEESWPTDLANQ